MLLFIEYVSPKKINFKKSYRKFRKLFSAAGEVRNLQVQADLLKKFTRQEDGMSENIRRLRIKIHSQRKHFKKELEKFDHIKSLGKIKAQVQLVSSSLGELSLKKSLFEFAAGNIRKAIMLEGENSFHKARRNLKDARFVLEIIKDDAKARALLKAMDPIEKATGKWRDWSLTSKYLEKSEKRKKPVDFNLKSDRIQNEIGKEITTLELLIKSDFKQLEELLSSNKKVTL